MKRKAIIEIKITKEQFNKEYTLRGKIGIWIGQILGIISVEFIK